MFSFSYFQMYTFSFFMWLLFVARFTDFFLLLLVEDVGSVPWAESNQDPELTVTRTTSPRQREGLSWTQSQSARVDRDGLVLNRNSYGCSLAVHTPGLNYHFLFPSCFLVSCCSQHVKWSRLNLLTTATEFEWLIKPCEASSWLSQKRCECSCSENGR